MSSLIGGALIWLLGNFDLITLLASFTLGIGVIDTIFSIRSEYERGREFERL
ncbi:hypothetical protein PbDSM24746_62690 [Paenibacillus macerans]|uniref:hypothetical protein n=1 Tax=Paenibacillus macerans TaxID=44252 RepID=UPI000ED96CC0|nr:hypothetical protein [Paenibacillus macerans]GBK66265.1 hypothetical protein PbDSM24746_62690 [Paenibacillus macerans]